LNAQSKFQIVSKVVDGEKMLLDSDVFVGSGGTMTAESALLGIPTISYNATPNRIEDYLVNKKIVTRCITPNKVAERITHVFQLTSYRGEGYELTRKLRIKKFVNSLEDPYPILLKTIKSIIK
jgi:predicted glycosyltransferase